MPILANVMEPIYKKYFICQIYTTGYIYILDLPAAIKIYGSDIKLFNVGGSLSWRTTLGCSMNNCNTVNDNCHVLGLRSERLEF